VAGRPINNKTLPKLLGCWPELVAVGEFKGFEGWMAVSTSAILDVLAARRIDPTEEEARGSLMKMKRPEPGRSCFQATVCPVARRVMSSARSTNRG
jgi:hypothetical protein